jgi:hypothetical protein
MSSKIKQHQERKPRNHKDKQRLIDNKDISFERKIRKDRKNSWKREDWND